MEAATFLTEFVNHSMLEDILSVKRSKQVMDVIRLALGNREIRDNYSISGVGYLRVEDRDSIPQAADFLLTEENAHTAIVYGIIIKNKQGLQVYIKNTLHERLSCPPLAQSSTQQVHFRQRLHLAANDYFISVGISEVRNGDMVHLDRRNDVVQFKVIGCESLGIVNLNSVIELR